MLGIGAIARAKHTAESRKCNSGPTCKCKLRVAFFASFLGGVVSGFSRFAFAAVADVILVHPLANKELIWDAMLQHINEWRAKNAKEAKLNRFILTMQAFAVILLIYMPDTLHRDLLPVLLLAIPAVFAGTLVGSLLWGKIDDAKLRCSVLSLLLISGLVLIH